MSHRGASTIVAGLSGIALLVGGCAGNDLPSSAGASTGVIPVVASTNVWGSVARAVGGDAVEVTSIINEPSADPHAYQSQPSDAAAMSAAKLTISNGGGYDDFFSGLAAESGGGARHVVAFDLAGTGQHQAGAGEVNEHVWYDLPTVRKVADAIAAELGAIAPEHGDAFAANARTFGGQLDELAGRLGQIGASKPGAKVIATEPVAAYLLAAAGLTDVTPPEFSEAIEEETDPPAQAVADATDLITGRQVALLVNNAQTQTPVTNQLTAAAQRAGIPVVNVTETLPEGVTSYVDWMTGQEKALSDALAK